MRIGASVSVATPAYTAMLSIGIAFCTVGLASGASLLTNPGFEQGATSWSWTTGCSTNQATVHSGARSLRIQTTDKSRVHWAQTKLSAQPGMRYRLSAWVKAKSVVGDGPAVLMDWYDRNGTWLGEGSSDVRTVNGTHDWQKLTAESTIMPSQAYSITVMLYLQSNTTGTVFFDDVLFSNEDVLNTVILYPNYRSTVFPWGSQRLDLGYRCLPNPGLNPANVALSAALQYSTGAVISSQSVRTLGSGSGTISFDLQSLSPGDYKVVALYSNVATGAQIRSTVLGFSLDGPTTPRPTVYIDQYNRCIVNGQPFFPLGFYTDGAVEDSAHQSQLATAGFNCMLSYGTDYYSVSGDKGFLDNAAAHGLKVIFGMETCYDGFPWSRQSLGTWVGGYQILQGLVSAYKTHPALLGWYLAEELPEDAQNDLIQHQNYIAATDPNHPGFQVSSTWENIDEGLKNTDVAGLDYYPVLKAGTGVPQMESFGAAVDATQSAVQRARPVWMVAECSSQRSYKSTSQTPSYSQIMCEAYQALTHGARGLIFYTLYHLWSENGASQWTVMTNVASQLNAIRSISLGLDASPNMAITASDSRISLITRVVGSNTYVLAVNPYTQSVPCTYTLGSGLSALRVDVGPPGGVSRSIQVSGRTFSDSIEPLGTRVYGIVTNQ